MADIVVDIATPPIPDGPPFFDTLADRLAGDVTLSSSELQWLVAELGEAIVVLHAAGLVHGSISPSTLLIRNDNGRERLVLADVDPLGAVTSPSDTSADVYAASAVVGRAAFGVGWHAVLVPTGPAQATALEPAGTEPLAYELRRGLSPDPALRHGTISEWTQSVAEALSDHVAVVTADLASERIGRRPVVRIVAAALVVLALLLAAASITRTSSTDDGSGPPAPAPPVEPG